MTETIISSDLTVEGDIKSDGNLSVDGRLIGNLNCKSVTINSGGSIEGNIEADQLTNLGGITGDIHAKGVELKEGSKTKSNLKSDNLQVSAGAVLKGKVHISGSGNQ